MVRVVPLLCLFMLLGPACGIGKVPDDPDFAFATLDFAVGGAPTCAQIVTCADTCATASCVTACEAGADPATIASFDVLETCARGVCLTTGPDGDGGAIDDAGTPACSGTTDSSAQCLSCISIATLNGSCPSNCEPQK